MNAKIDHLFKFPQSEGYRGTKQRLLLCCTAGNLIAGILYFTKLLVVFCILTEAYLPGFSIPY